MLKSNSMPVMRPRMQAPGSSPRAGARPSKHELPQKMSHHGSFYFKNASHVQQMSPSPATDIAFGSALRPRDYPKPRAVAKESVSWYEERTDSLPERESRPKINARDRRRGWRGSNWSIDNSKGSEAKATVSKLFRRVTHLFKAGLITYDQRQIVKGYVISGRFREAKAMLDSWKQERTRSKVDRVTGYSQEDRAAVNDKKKKLKKAARVLGIEDPDAFVHENESSNQSKRRLAKKRRFSTSQFDRARSGKTAAQKPGPRKSTSFRQVRNGTFRKRALSGALSRSSSLKEIFDTFKGGDALRMQNKDGNRASDKRASAREDIVGPSARSKLSNWDRKKESHTVNASAAAAMAPAPVTSLSTKSLLESKSSDPNMWSPSFGTEGQLEHFPPESGTNMQKNAAKMTRLTGYSPEDLSIEQDYRKALRILGASIDDVDLRREIHLPRGRSRTASKGKSRDKVDRLTGTSAAMRKSIDQVRSNPARLLNDNKIQMIHADSFHRQSKIDRITGVSGKERSLVDAKAYVNSRKQQHNTIMARMKNEAAQREIVDRNLGKWAAQENDDLMRVEIMYPHEELAGLSPEEFFTHVILNTTLHRIVSGSDILKDWKFRVLFDIFENQNVIKTYLMNEQQKQDAVGQTTMVGHKHNKNHAGKKKVGFMRGIMSRRNRPTQNKHFEPEEEDLRDATPASFGLDHKVGLALMSLLDACYGLQTRVVALKSRLDHSQNASSSAADGKRSLESNQKLLRLILKPALDAMICELKKFYKSRNDTSTSLQAGALVSWLERCKHSLSLLSAHRPPHTSKTEVQHEEETWHEHTNIQRECMSISMQLAQEVSEQASSALECHVDGFKQWLSLERWRLHNDSSYIFNPWYNVSREKVHASLSYHHSKSSGMTNLNIVTNE